MLFPFFHRALPYAECHKVVGLGLFSFIFYLFTFYLLPFSFHLFLPLTSYLLPLTPYLLPLTSYLCQYHTTGLEL